MKAVLVIDMPTHCGECPVKCRMRGINHVPTWCLLKPLPNKLDVKAEKFEDIMHTSLMTDKFIAEITIETDKVFALGWNTCLEKITGETE